jgi:precorrin-2/cobalt-factor-2 C20-methyltransferase
MEGKLYVIGVGPGDPELLTLKAVRILEKAECLCVPKGKEEGQSLALSIVRKAVDLGDKEIIEAHFPMQKTAQRDHAKELDSKWEIASREIADRLKRGTDIAFITIGDPTIYSTFFYLYDRLTTMVPGVDIEIIPGVSSINASAARAHLPLGLGNGKIAVLPANYLADLRTTLEQFDTVVLMKVHQVFQEIKEILSELNLLENAVFISRAGMEDESVHRDLSRLSPENLSYFSMVIVKK